MKVPDNREFIGAVFEVAPENAKTLESAVCPKIFTNIRGLRLQFRKAGFWLVALI